MRFLIKLIIILTVFTSCKQNDPTQNNEDSSLLNNEVQTNKPQSPVGLEKWITKQDDVSFKSNSLPFLFETYFENNFPDKTYPYYGFTRI